MVRRWRFGIRSRLFGVGTRGVGFQEGSEGGEEAGESASAVLAFELFEEAEGGLQNFGAEGETLAFGQWFGRAADEFDELVGDGSAGRVGGERVQECGELVSCTASQTLLIDERESGIDDLLTGVPARDVCGELTQPAELVGEALGGDLAPRCRVGMRELPRSHAGPLQRRCEVHEASLGTGTGRGQVAEFGLLNGRAS